VIVEGAGKIFWWQVAEGRAQRAGRRRQGAEGRRQEAGGRKKEGFKMLNC